VVKDDGSDDCAQEEKPVTKSDDPSVSNGIVEEDKSKANNVDTGETEVALSNKEEDELVVRDDGNNDCAQEEEPSIKAQEEQPDPKLDASDETSGHHEVEQLNVVEQSILALHIDKKSIIDVEEQVDEEQLISKQDTGEKKISDGIEDCNPEEQTQATTSAGQENSLLTTDEDQDEAAVNTEKEENVKRDDSTPDTGAEDSTRNDYVEEDMQQTVSNSAEENNRIDVSNQENELIPNTNVDKKSCDMQDHQEEVNREVVDENFVVENIDEVDTRVDDESIPNKEAGIDSDSKKDESESDGAERSNPCGEGDENEQQENLIEEDAVSGDVGAFESALLAITCEEDSSQKKSATVESSEVGHSVDGEEAETLSEKRREEQNNEQEKKGETPTSGELLNIIEKTGFLAEENAEQHDVFSLSSFLSDKGERRVVTTPKDHGNKKNGDEMDDQDSEMKSSNHSSSSGKKPMSMNSLSDYLCEHDTSKKSTRSEASPIDEESSGGWSDDDSATIKSEFTDITYGTLGSAVNFVDATDLTSTDEASKKLRRMVAQKASQSKEDIIPGPPPSTKPPPDEEILFTPQVEESDGSESDNGGDTKKAGKSMKKKKKKKSKKSKDNSIDIQGNSELPKKKKKKKKERKKVATLEEDIVFDFNANASNPSLPLDTCLADDDTFDRTKKKKKKKKRKEEVHSDDDSNGFDSDEKQASDDNAEKYKKKKKKKKPPIEIAE